MKRKKKVRLKIGNVLISIFLLMIVVGGIIVINYDKNMKDKEKSNSTEVKKEKKEVNDTSKVTKDLEKAPVNSI